MSIARPGAFHQQRLENALAHLGIEHAAARSGDVGAQVHESVIDCHAPAAFVTGFEVHHESKVQVIENVTRINVDIQAGGAADAGITVDGHAEQIWLDLVRPFIRICGICRQRQCGGCQRGKEDLVCHFKFPSENLNRCVSRMQNFDDAFLQTCEPAWPFVSTAGSTCYPLHDNGGKWSLDVGQLIVVHTTSAELPQHVVRKSNEDPEALVRRQFLVHELVERLALQLA